MNYYSDLDIIVFSPGLCSRKAGMCSRRAEMCFRSTLPVSKNIQSGNKRYYKSYVFPGNNFNIEGSK